MINKEMKQSWTLIGAVIEDLGGVSNLSLGDILLIKKEVEKYQQHFFLNKYDTRKGPDFQEADVVLVILAEKYGFDIKKSDKIRRGVVKNYTDYEDYEELSNGNPKAKQRIYSALLNVGRTQHSKNTSIF